MMYSTFAFWIFCLLFSYFFNRVLINYCPILKNFINKIVCKGNIGTKLVWVYTFFFCYSFLRNSTDIHSELLFDLMALSKQPSITPETSSGEGLDEEPSSRGGMYLRLIILTHYIFFTLMMSLQLAFPLYYITLLHYIFIYIILMLYITFQCSKQLSSISRVIYQHTIVHLSLSCCHLIWVCVCVCRSCTYIIDYQLIFR